MGIVNAGMIAVYQEIQKDLLKSVEDILLNSDDRATERLLELAENIMVIRDLEILKYTNSKLHISTISTKKSVQNIKKA